MDRVMDLVKRAVAAGSERERENLSQQVVSAIRREWEAKRPRKTAGDEFDERDGNRGIG